MELQTYTHWISTAAATIICLVVATERANAASLKAINEETVVSVFAECLNDGIALEGDKNPQNPSGWQIAFDSFSDGVDGFQVGGIGNRYEFHTLGIRETEDSIWVALNGNMPLTGIDGTSAVDGNIGWGDLFFDFSGLGFTAASNLGRLFGVRFAGTNDSLAPTIGLYGNVRATSVTAINSGFNSLEAYNTHVATNCPPGQNCGPTIGDLPANTPYFDQNQSLNAIASGEYLTGLTYLSNSDLLAGGYDSRWFSGAHTIAFKFDKSAICERGECRRVPEPTSAIGIVGLGILGIASRWKRKQRLTSNM